MDYPKRPSFRDEIRQAIDRALQAKPKDFEAFLRLLEQEGYTCKRGKHTALRGKAKPVIYGSFLGRRIF